MKTDETKKTVDINTRYSSAWSEINTRLTLRTQNISIFITLMLGVATLSQLKVENLDTQWIVLAVPIISLMSAMTHYMHSRIIQNLTSYLEDLEEFNNPCDDEIPNYLADKDYGRSDE